MHDLGSMSARRLAAVLLVFSFGLGACGGAAAPTAIPNGGSTSSPAASAGASVPAGGVDVQGSLASSGLYAATWTWQPGNEADIGIGGVTLNSDKGTFGNIQVLADGSITFSSGAPELSAGQPFTGTGAQVHMKNVGGADLPCGFTLDNDLTGSNGGVLHLKATLTVIGTPFNC